MAFVEDLSGIEQHRAMPDPREVALDLEAFHHLVLRDNLFQKQPEFRDVPKTVFQIVDFMPLRRRSRHFERSIEGAARNNDSQILIEHEERFADRVHDRFGQQECLFAILKSITIGRQRREPAPYPGAPQAN